ncbi:MAG TPA: murein L,D-transpeptidase catalytic domain family protein [Chryseolinea sp.]
MPQATKKLQRTFLCMALVAILVSIAVKNVNASFKRPADFDTQVLTLFQKIKFNGTPPPYDLFYRAFTGYSKLKKQNLLSAKEILTVIDFRISGNEKRLWVIDLKNETLLFHVLTAHGRNSGNVFAKTFSNTINSNQSSLGFYVTGNKYIGKHGISLKLRGVEKGINDNAEARAIVMHAADYVSESHIKKYGRLGRSFGCPAVPVDGHKEIIDTLSQGTCLFIYYPDTDYLTRTAIKGTADL